MIVMKHVLSAQTALSLVRHAFTHAQAQGWPVAIAVTDPDGEMLAALLMDGVGPHILGFASDKAYTAALMRVTTKAYFEEVSQRDDSRIVLANRQRFIVWGGGLPVVHDGRVVGGIGVSGATAAEDIECAQAALTAEGLDWAVPGQAE